MAQRFLFFNSTSNDRRKYDAKDFSDYFGSVLSTGVLHVDEQPGLFVSVEQGTMNTIVGPGKAIMKGHLYENTTPHTLTHSLPEPNLDRIDRIVLRLDLRQSQRNILLHVKEGQPAENPEPPALQRDNLIYEISLARILVRRNTSSLQPIDLQDERLDEDVCGLVYSLISIPTSQFKEQWETFYNTIKDEMDTETQAYFQQLAQNILQFEQDWEAWFSDIQDATFVPKSEFNAHVANDVTEPQGVHGIRVVNRQLEYWDKNDQEWKRIAGGVKIYGLEWNQTLDTYQRLDDAVGMSASTRGRNDFSNVYPWSEMKRCNLNDDGEVQAYFGDPTYADDGSNGQVMVQIPKFWYRSEMIVENEEKKYRWWIADNELKGFKLHPAFVRNGVEKDYIYIGAYEGVMSGVMLYSQAGFGPAVSWTIAEFRQAAQNRGSIWHLQDFLTICAIQLLYLIEYAHFDAQTKIGRGVTSASGFGSTTGATAQYGNRSYGTTSNGTTAMSYRGIENLYGNLWEWVDGININNRRAYIADHNFQSDKFDGHYRQVGFTNATASGYVKDIGWTEQDDFMFLAIDTTGSASSYLHDRYNQNTGARVARFGGHRVSGTVAGMFCWYLDFTSSSQDSNTGARLMCIP